MIVNKKAAVSVPQKHVAIRVNAVENFSERPLQLPVNESSLGLGMLQKNREDTHDGFMLFMQRKTGTHRPEIRLRDSDGFFLKTIVRIEKALKDQTIVGCRINDQLHVFIGIQGTRRAEHNPMACLPRTIAMTEWMNGSPFAFCGQKDAKI